MIEIEDFTVPQARKSALVVAGVLTLLAAWQLYRGRPTAAELLGVAVIGLLVCSAIPAAAVRFHKAWMTLAAALGYVNSRIILAVLFFLVVTPIGLVARLVGHDPLERRGQGTPHWHKRAETRQSRAAFERAY